LTRHPSDLDQLVEKCGLDSGRVSACLVELQLAGYVVQKAGGRFEKS
jgi:predicted Rossmann fold nucleotide-binding protein DprA/Smf involved in DNA uptake